MKIKKTKFLTTNQNFLFIIFSVFLISILNIGLNEKNKLKFIDGISGNFIVLNKLQPYHYLKSRNITQVLEERAFLTVNQIIQKRYHTLSLKNCKFSKKTDLITKINMAVEKNLGKISVKYQISPVEDVLECKESIFETIINNLQILIDKELIKYNNELEYIGSLEKNIYKLLKIEGPKENIVDLFQNQPELTIFEKLQIDEKLFELKTRESRLKDIIEIVSNKNNIIYEEYSSTSYVDGEFPVKSINFRFIGNALLIISLISIYLLVIFLKNKKII